MLYSAKTSGVVVTISGACPLSVHRVQRACSTAYGATTAGSMVQRGTGAGSQSSRYPAPRLAAADCFDRDLPRCYAEAAGQDVDVPFSAGPGSLGRRNQWEVDPCHSMTS